MPVPIGLLSAKKIPLRSKSKYKSLKVLKGNYFLVFRDFQQNSENRNPRNKILTNNLYKNERNLSETDENH